jgi:hypothetical protein
VLPGRAQKNPVLLIANGSHRQIAYPGPLRELVRLPCRRGSLASDRKAGILGDINANDFATHLQMFVVFGRALVADRKELEF